MGTADRVPVKPAAAMVEPRIPRAALSLWPSPDKTGAPPELSEWAQCLAHMQTVGWPVAAADRRTAAMAAALRRWPAPDSTPRPRGLHAHPRFPEPAERPAEMRIPLPPVAAAARPAAAMAAAAAARKPAIRTARARAGCSAAAGGDATR